MHTDDAKAFGIEDRDEVEVAITGGPRDLIFCDVLVRVSPDYKLEMHIDTDETNAAELSNGYDIEVVYSEVDAAASIRKARKPWHKGFFTPKKMQTIEKSTQKRAQPFVTLCKVVE